MFKNLDIFKMSHAMAVHAGQKQAIAAENVANSDTPNFKARTVAPFSDSFEENSKVLSSLSLKVTRSKHFDAPEGRSTVKPIIDEMAVGSPNGNTVSLETEMLKSLDAKRQHDRALAIYKSSLGLLRSTLSRS